MSALNAFKTHGVNLQSIESLPAGSSSVAADGSFRFQFFVELEGHPSDARVERALAELGLAADTIRVLGAFPAATATA
jgi:prephenate dehydratase